MRVVPADESVQRPRSGRLERRFGFLSLGAGSLANAPYASLPSRSSRSPAFNNLGRQAKRDQLARVGRVRPPAFVHSGASKHLVRRFGKVLVLGGLHGMRINTLQVGAQSTARGGFVHEHWPFARRPVPERRLLTNKTAPGGFKGAGACYSRNRTRFEVTKRSLPRKSPPARCGTGPGRRLQVHCRDPGLIRGANPLSHRGKQGVGVQLGRHESDTQISAHYPKQRLTHTCSAQLLPTCRPTGAKRRCSSDKLVRPLHPEAHTRSHLSRSGRSPRRSLSRGAGHALRGNLSWMWPLTNRVAASPVDKRSPRRYALKRPVLRRRDRRWCARP